MVLRPLTIQVGEDVRPTSENGEALVIGEFLEAQPDSSFRVLLPVAESLRRGGMDVTLHHPTNLGKLLSQAPGKLAALPATAPAATPVLSRAEVLVGRGGVLPFPVQTAAASASGVYRSFDNFRATRLMATARPFEVKPTPRGLKGKLGPIDELEVFYLGLSDGHTHYIVDEDRLYPLLPGTDGHSFTFTAQAPPAMAGSDRRALMGGLVGGAIGGGAGGQDCAARRPRHLRGAHAHGPAPAAGQQPE